MDTICDDVAKNYLLSFLEAREVLRLSSISKSMHKTWSCNHIWKMLLKRTFPEEFIFDDDYYSNNSCKLAYIATVLRIKCQGGRGTDYSTQSCSILLCPNTIWEDATLPINCVHDCHTCNRTICMHHSIWVDKVHFTNGYDICSDCRWRDTRFPYYYGRPHGPPLYAFYS